MASLFLALVVVLGVLTAHGNANAAATAAGKKVVIAYAAMNARVAPLWVARERGFFAKYGVSADTIFVRGAPTLVAAMAANEIDVGYTGGTAVVGAVAGVMRGRSACGRCACAPERSARTRRIAIWCCRRITRSLSTMC